MLIFGLFIFGHSSIIADCLTSYTISYPESICLGNIFDFNITLEDGVGPYTITIYDQNNNLFGYLNNIQTNEVSITTIPQTIEGIYSFTIEIENDLIFCEDIVKSNFSSNEMEVKSVSLDYESLMTLYYSTNGDGWDENFGWFAGAKGQSCNPCNWNGEPWYGIRCNLDNRVTCVDLDGSVSCLGGLVVSSSGGNNLVGTIPKELGQLTYLKYLTLSYNQLSGLIPYELTQLSDLDRLFLSHNNLGGCIPIELLDFCENVWILLNSNPLLPWEGDINQFCATETIEDQIGAPCNDGLNSNGPENISESCNCESTTALFYQRQEENIFISPNPIGNFIRISGVQREWEFNIINIIGESIKDGKTNDNIIYLSKLSSGLYYLQLFEPTSKRILKYKIIK